jgi:predicted transcriptional regulator
MLLLEKKSVKLGLSESELARRSGVNQVSVNGIFRGRMIAYPGQREKINFAMREAGWDGNGDLFSEVSDDATA